MFRQFLRFCLMCLIICSARLLDNSRLPSCKMVCIADHSSLDIFKSLLCQSAQAFVIRSSKLLKLLFDSVYDRLLSTRTWSTVKPAFLQSCSIPNSLPISCLNHIDKEWFSSNYFWERIDNLTHIHRTRIKIVLLSTCKGYHFSQLFCATKL